jgi:hypothetical protein
MAKPKCEVCNTPSDTLHLRDLDGAWCCWGCVPESEKAALRAAREGEKKE